MKYIAWLVLVLALYVPAVQSSNAQAEATPFAQIINTPAGVRIRWHGTVGRAPGGEPTLAGWERVTFGSLAVPAQLVTVRLAPRARLQPQITRLKSAAWNGTIAAAPRQQSGVAPAERATLAPEGKATLPDAPISVLRTGYMRGTHVAVVAIHPVYQAEGAHRAATSIEALLPNATSIDMATLPSTSDPFVPHAAAPTFNPDAARAAWVVAVEHAGIQELPAATLRHLGLDLATVDASKLQLRRRGQEIALEERRAANGTLDALAFYASTPGDRWNSADAYWLTLQATTGKRIMQRSVAPGNAPVRTTAIAYGTVRDSLDPTNAPIRRIYDSTVAGADGDHWFGADLRAIPGETSAGVSLPLSPTLPLAQGTTTITLSLTGYTPTEHALRVSLGNTAVDVGWGGAGDQTHTVHLATTEAAVRLAAIPQTAISGMLLDRMDWQALATLRFAGRGAFFDGIAGTWRYQLSATAATRALYDITDPSTPQRLLLPHGQTTSVQDGPRARRYVLAGAGTAWTPTVKRHEATDLRRSLAADTLYIAPADLHAALAPLLDLRRTQGHRVAVVDVAATYDAWNWGNVAPDAIREFLQYAVAEWSVAPTTVALVGDGTSDPHDYLGFHQRNLVPPLLAMVDPFMGETACEPCFGNLDGTDPATDPLPDVDVGRIPVASADELRAVVAKLVAYETAPADSRWQRRALFFADNYREANGSTDGAGDFATFAESVVALLPQGIEPTRVYYDPYAPTSPQPGHEPNATRAREKVMAAMSAGAGIATYIGHAHYYQLAVTQQPQSLFGLYDVDPLQNAPRLPIMLEMTCLTSAFFQPNFSGMTIDERLLRYPTGGAAAVWGPTGLGLAYGHDQLLRGFYRELWHTEGPRPTMGELTRAGFTELWSNGTCCQESLHTFALLGDPLTIPRAAPGWSVYAPMVRR